MKVHRDDVGMGIVFGPIIAAIGVGNVYGWQWGMVTVGGIWTLVAIWAIVRPD